MRWFALGIIILSLTVPAVPAAAREDSAVTPARVEPGLVLRLAPECDRIVQVRLDGIAYAVGLLHNHWRVAVSTYAVQTGGDTYRLIAAFNRDGTLAEVASEPPARLASGLAEACVGLSAEAICPLTTRPRDPLAVLNLAACNFARVLADGRLERAVVQQLVLADAVTGATP